MSTSPRSAIAPPLVVYTAITGDAGDTLRPPLVESTRGPVRYVCFTDTPRHCAGWEIRRPVWEHYCDPRRTARYHKILSHVLFPSAPCSLWLDGTHQLTGDPWQLVDRFLPEGCDAATFKHSQRNCLYQELNACLQLRKDDRAVMTAQVNRYRKQGYPLNLGLFETGVLLRRHGACDEMNDAWWHEIATGSRRDQLSLPYVAWRLKLWPRIALFPGTVRQSDFFLFFKHR